MDGWLKIHRKLLDWQWYGDIYCVRLFLHLLLTCDGKARRLRGRDFAAGSLLTSVDTLADELKLDQHIVIATLRKLESTGDITRDKLGAAGTVVTIRNWRKYQTNVSLTDANESLGRTQRIVGENTTHRCEIPNDDSNDTLGRTQRIVGQDATISPTPPNKVCDISQQEGEENYAHTREKNDAIQPLPPPPTLYPTLDPKGVRLVRDTAIFAGHQMSEDEARLFVAHYAAQNWRGAQGQPINWRFKVVEWCLNNKKEIQRNANQSNGNNIRGTNYVSSDFSDYETTVGG